MKFAKIIFWIAGIYGLVVITPLYFLANRIGQQDPPPITHPGFYYGFVGVAIAWQIAFFVFASDPARLGPIITRAALKKTSLGVPILFLYTHVQVHTADLGFGVP